MLIDHWKAFCQFTTWISKELVANYPNLNDYHSDPMEIRITFWIPDITNRWRKQEETHSTYTDLSNVIDDIFSFMPLAIGVEASFSVVWDDIVWRESKTTRETIREKVIVRQSTRGNSMILQGDDPGFHTTNTENDSEIWEEAAKWQLHRMAKVNNFLEMWQGSQNLCTTLNKSLAQKKHMTAVGYISNLEQMIKASWLHFQHDGAAAFKLPERSPLPPASSAKNQPRRWTQIFNACWLRRIDHHPVKIDYNCAPEII